MSAIDQQVGRARRRLTTNILLERAALGIVVGAAAWSLALLVERLFVLGVPLLAGLGAAAGLAAVVALIGTYLARVDRLRAAVAIDGAARLKERLSTALTCRRDPDPFVQVAVHDAEKTAGRVHVPTHLRLHAPALWPWSLATVLVALILYAFLPAFDLLADEEQPQAEQLHAAAVERQQVTAVVNEQLNKIKELAEKNPDLKALAENLQPLSLPDEPTATPEDIRREAVKRLDKVADKLTERKDQLNPLKQLARMMARLDKQQGDDAASKLSRALAQGDMESAKQALSELKKQLEQAATKGDPQARRQVAELQKKLDKLSKQLAKLGETTQLRKELERKAGLSEEDAQKLLDKLAQMDPKQMQKELQRQLADSGMTQKQIEDLAKKLADQKAAMRKSQGLGKSLAQAAAAVQQSDSPNGAAAVAAAMAALDAAAGQLSDLEMAQQMLDELEAELADLGKARAGI